MAVKQVILSDLSGDELDESQHVTVHVKHPDNNFAVALDLSVEEASKLVNTTLRLVEFDIFEPGKAPRKAQIESKTLDKLFSGVNFDDVLASAPKAATTASAGRARRAPSTASGPKVDYTSPEYAGQIHRGRVTDAEAEWVRNNKEQASKNREQQTGSPIDFNDPVEQKRYGIK